MSPETPPETPCPEMPVYAIGDLHGCAGLLGDLIELLNADAARTRDTACLVFLGDYVDRGEESGKVLTWLVELSREFPEDVVCLRGNHEQMLLDFLDAPETQGRRWLRHGGLQTLQSLGVGGVSERSGPAELAECAARVRAALPPGAVDWLQGLPLWWQSGDVVFVHAGMDPAAGPEQQVARELLWGNALFERYDRPDGLWVVHGHDVVETARVRGRRVACDTGAYVTGRLTAAAIFPGAPVRFLEARRA